MSQDRLSVYKACKKDMKTGNLLVWREDSYCMRLWRLVTHSEWNHSSMVLRLPEFESLEKRRFTTESRIHGTVLNLLSRRLQE
jgi:hypothetical protein